MSPALPGLVEFMEKLGFLIGNDAEKNPYIAYPPDFTGEDFANGLHAHATALSAFIERRAELQRRQYASGPRVGQLHGYNPDLCNVFAVHAGRRKWEAYELWPDGRAYHRGMARTKQKAEELARNNPVLKHRQEGHAA